MRLFPRLIVVLIAFFIVSCGGLDTSGRVELGQEQVGTLDGQHPTGDYWFDAEYDGTYVVLAQSSVFADLTLSIYSDYQRTRLVQDCDVVSYEMCLVTLTRGRYFVRVHSLSASVFSGTLGLTVPYQFEIVAGENEGTADAPIALDPDAPTHTVAPSGASYYVYDVPTAGGLDFAVTPTASGLTPQVNARLYAGADFSSVPITGTCTSTGCRFFGVPSGPIGIRVDEEGGLPAVFELTITATLSEGAPSEPVPLTLGVNYQDASVDSDSIAFSYYSVTTGPSAGSLVFNAAGATQSAGLSVKIYETYPSVVAGTCSAAYGTTTCAIGNLEANTTYVVAVRTDTNESGYTLSASTGLAEGSTRSPVVLALGVAEPGQVDLGTSSYYALTPTESNLYTFEKGGTDVSLTVRDSVGTVVYCSLACGLDAGNVYSIEVKRYGTDTAYALTVTKDASGEGTPSDRVELVPDVLHSSTLRQTSVSPFYGESYYSFTTDADGDAYGLWIKSDKTLSFSTNIPYGAVERTTTTPYGASGEIRAVTYQGLAANTTYTIDVSAQTPGAPNAIEFLLLDLDATEPCEPGNLYCQDFTAASPVGINNNSAGGQKWSSDVANGEFDAGSTSPSCFDLTSPVGTRVMSLKLRVASTISFDDLRVYVGGSPSASFTLDAASSNGIDLRRFVPVSGGLLVQVCFYGTGTRSASIDNLAFR